MKEEIEKQGYINLADKFIFYSASLCCLISYRYETPFFLNFAMGFVAGGAIFNFLFCLAIFKKVMKDDG